PFSSLFFFSTIPPPPTSTLFPYTTLFRSEKLRASGFAPPALRELGGPKLVQLQSNAFRCPYCGSQDTALENIFGPTPCRSVRYCRSCRQPFEQFKTI